MNKQLWAWYKVEANKTFHINNFQKAYNYIDSKIICELGEVLSEYTDAKYHESIPNYLSEFGDVFYYLAHYEIITMKNLSRFNIDSTMCDLKNVIQHYIDHQHHSYVFNWCLKVLAEVNLTVKDVLEYNIEKIRKRHGESYNEAYYKGDRLKTLKND